MSARIALCIEEDICRNPQIMGLEGEVLDAQPWLDVYTSGEEARNNVAEDADTEELWVLSCDDVEPINLAASIKSDRPNLHVCLVTSQPCGSLLSRAHTAGIDEVVESRAFIHRYAQAKQRLSNQVGLDEVEIAHTEVSPIESAFDKSEVYEAVCSNDDKMPSADEAALCADSEKDSLLGESSNMVVTDSSTVAELVPQPLETGEEEQQSVVPITRFLQFRSSLVQEAMVSESRSFVLTVVSGSGGAGKSAVSALSALIASGWGYKTLLLDCDLQFGDVAAMVGVEEPLCVDEVLAKPDVFQAEVARAESFVVIAAPSRLEASEEVVQRLPELIDRLAGLFEVVVVNTGASWAEQHAALLERSSVALFLIDQRVSSVRACRHALELCARCGIAASPFQYALNRCAKGAPLSTMDVSSALQGVPVFELKDGGRDVEDYLSGGAARELIETRNEFVKSLERVMERLLPHGTHKESSQASSSGERRSLRRRSKRGRRKE